MKKRIILIYCLILTCIILICSFLFLLPEKTVKYAIMKNQNSTGYRTEYLTENEVKVYKEKGYIVIPDSD